MRCFDPPVGRRNLLVLLTSILLAAHCSNQADGQELVPRMTSGTALPQAGSALQSSSSNLNYLTPTYATDFTPEPTKLTASARQSEYKTVFAPELASSNFTKLISKIATSTLFVIVACVAFLVLYKAFGNKKFATAQPRGTDSNFRILETIRLGQRNTLQLVEASGSRFVVGVDQNGIKSIVPVNSFEECLDTRLEESSEALASSSTTPDWLATLKRSLESHGKA